MSTGGPHPGNFGEEGLSETLPFPGLTLQRPRPSALWAEGSSETGGCPGAPAPSRCHWVSPRGQRGRGLPARQHHQALPSTRPPSLPPHAPTADVTGSHGKWPDLTSSLNGSFYSSFHGNSHRNVGKEGGARIFKIMAVEKLSGACISCYKGFHGNTNQRQSRMAKALGVFHHGSRRPRDDRPPFTRKEHVPRSLRPPSPGPQGCRRHEGARERGRGLPPWNRTRETRHHSPPPRTTARTPATHTPGWQTRWGWGEQGLVPRPLV